MLVSCKHKKIFSKNSPFVPNKAVNIEYEILYRVYKKKGNRTLMCSRAFNI